MSWVMDRVMPPHDCDILRSDLMTSTAFGHFQCIIGEPGILESLCWWLLDSCHCFSSKVVHCSV